MANNIWAFDANTAAPSESSRPHLSKVDMLLQHIHTPFLLL